MFKLKLETDNDAFQSGNGANEIANILHDVAERIEDGSYGGTCHDTNGNSVGYWTYEE